jgi:uncharacterized oxidoreductase
MPLLLKQKEAAIVNVSSGLGFVPIAAMPVYCATKAALHSFTYSLRYQLKDTSIKVFEIIPPAVETDLGKESPGEESGYKGIPAGEAAKAFLEALAKDKYEVTVGESEGLSKADQASFAELFNQMNQW